jgi:hypothetical protein
MDVGRVRSAVSLLSRQLRTVSLEKVREWILLFEPHLVEMVVNIYVSLCTYHLTLYRILGRQPPTSFLV